MDLPLLVAFDSAAPVEAADRNPPSDNANSSSRDTVSKSRGRGFSGGAALGLRRQKSFQSNVTRTNTSPEGSLALRNGLDRPPLSRSPSSNAAHTRQKSSTPDQRVLARAQTNASRFATSNSPSPNRHPTNENSFSSSNHTGNASVISANTVGSPLVNGSLHEVNTSGNSDISGFTDVASPNVPTGNPWQRVAESTRNSRSTKRGGGSPSLAQKSDPLQPDLDSVGGFAVEYLFTLVSAFTYIVVFELIETLVRRHGGSQNKGMHNSKCCPSRT